AATALGDRLPTVHPPYMSGAPLVHGLTSRARDLLELAEILVPCLRALGVQFCNFALVLRLLRQEGLDALDEAAGGMRDEDRAFGEVLSQHRLIGQEQRFVDRQPVLRCGE